MSHCCSIIIIKEIHLYIGHLAIVHEYRGHEILAARQSSVLDDDPNTPLLQNNRDDDDDTLLDIRSQVNSLLILKVFLYFCQVLYIHGYAVFYL